MTSTIYHEPNQMKREGERERERERMPAELGINSISIHLLFFIEVNPIQWGDEGFIEL
jgi:hypothetical protein